MDTQSTFNEDQDLNKIIDINVFLDKLKDRLEKYLVIVAVKDTPGFFISDDTIEKLSDLGLKVSLKNKHGHSYIAVINRGIVFKEIISTYDESVIINDEIEEDIKINVLSSVFQKENSAVIMINGVDYSQNRRGLNFALYDVENKCIYDRVTFDKHSPDNSCIRSAIMNTYALSGMDDPITYKLLSEKIEKQNVQIENLKNSIAVYNEKINILLWQIFKKEGESDKESKKRFFRNLPPATGQLRKMQLVGIILLKYFDQICRANDIDYWLCGGTLIGAVRNGGFIPWDDDVDVHMFRDDFEKLKAALKDNQEFGCYNFLEIWGPTDRHLNKGYKVYIKGLNSPTTLDIFVFDRADKSVEKKVKDLNKIKQRMELEVWTPTRLSVVPNSQMEFQKGFLEKDPGYPICLDFFNKYLNEYKNIIGEVKSNDYIVWGIDNPNFMWGNKRIIKYSDVFPLKEIEFEGVKYRCPNNAEGYLKFIYGDIYNIPNDVLHRHFSLNKDQEKSVDKVLNRFIDQKHFIEYDKV